MYSCDLSAFKSAPFSVESPMAWIQTTASCIKLFFYLSTEINDHIVLYKTCVQVFIGLKVL